MRVFLSYSTLDHNDADKIRRALEMRRPDLDVYFAPRRNELGAYWMKKLGTELDAADAVLLLLGRRIGPWQELEYYHALKRHRKTERPLIAPVLLGDAVPGLHFLDHFHRLSMELHELDELVGLILDAFDGVEIDDPTPHWRQINPYRGLLSMETESAAYFFGREELTGEILDRIAASPERIHTLIGNSGVGKSSVAKAGVLAALKSRLWPDDWDRVWPDGLADSNGWPVVSFAPGETPVKVLARSFAGMWLESPADIETEAIKWHKLLMGDSSLSALVEATLSKVAEQVDAEPSECLILYVDQAEELYSRAEPQEAQRFSTLLAEAVARPELIVMTSIRSDYYGRLQDDAPLFAATDTIDVLPFDRDQIERIIRVPAEKLGVRFENPEMIDLIISAAAREPGATPMLSDLLADAWQRMVDDPASDGAIRFPHEIVDISRPLADKAERFLAQHRGDEETLRRLFTLKLAHVPKEGEAVRRRVHRSKCSEEEWALVERLAHRNWRLLTTGGEGREATVEVAHEALLQRWPLLTRWLDESREFLIWKGRLEAARREWEAATESVKPKALLMGLLLDTARRWKKERGEDLVDDDCDFIDRSIALEEARKAEEARRRQELEDERTRSETRRRWITRLSVAAAIVFAVLGGLAAWKWTDAYALRAQAEKALAAEEQARAVAVDAAKQARLSADRADQALIEATLQLRQARLERARFRADKALEFADRGDNSKAIALALLAMPEADSEHWPSIEEIPKAPNAMSIALFDLRELDVLRGHEGRVYSAAFSPDGARVVTASEDATARVWDAATGLEIVALRGHEGSVRSAAFSPDGARIVTASEDGTARVWDAATGEEVDVLRDDEMMSSILSAFKSSAAFSPDGARIVTITKHGGTVRVWDAATGAEIAVLRDWGAKPAFSPDGTRIVTISIDNSAQVWDAATGAEITVLRFDRHQGVYSAAFSPDGARIVLAGGFTAKIWDAATGAEITVLRDHGRVYSAAFSPDGTRVVTASEDARARVWDAATGVEIFTLRGHEDSVKSAAFSLDGTRIVTTSLDGTARVWDAATGKEVDVLRGDKGNVSSAVFSPDGARIVTASEDGTARIWDAATGVEIFTLRGHEDSVKSAAFSPNGARIVTASDDDTARVWDATTGAEITVLRGHQDSVYSAVFSPDSARIITASGDDTARVWDATTGVEIAVLRGHESYVISAAFSPNGARIVTASDDDTARIWDAATGAEITVLRGHKGLVWSAAFSPDGTRIVTASRDGTARVWDATTGAEIAVLRNYLNRPVWRASFSPDGSRIVAATRADIVRVWDAATAAEIHALRGHGDAVLGAAFSPDGARIVTASWDETARVWDAATGAEIAILRGHKIQSPYFGKGGVKSAAFSPDGARIVTSSWDRTARVWDAATGVEIVALRGHKGELNSAAFSPDGARIVTASEDGTARIWEHYRTYDELLDAAREVVERLQPLTKDEYCEFYLRTEGCEQ